MSETAAPAQAHVYPRATVAWLTVTILFVLYIRSLADRYLMALMVEPIKQDLGLSDLQISLLQGPAFAVLYCICAVPVGLLLDRSSRRWVLFGCIVVWSAGAAFCGLAGTFAVLALGRSLVGAGESGYTTGSYSIIGDSFAPTKVSLAMSVFVMGGVMGAGIVFLLGGPMVGAILDGAIADWPGMSAFKPWQQAFIVTGVPGILTALLVFLFPEPRRQQRSAPATAGSGGYGEERSGGGGGGSFGRSSAMGSGGGGGSRQPAMSGGGGSGGGGSMKVTFTTSSSSTSCAGGEIGASSSNRAEACRAMAKLMPAIRGQLKPPSRSSLFSDWSRSCVMRTALVWEAPYATRRGDIKRP